MALACSLSLSPTAPKRDDSPTNTSQPKRKGVDEDEDFFLSLAREKSSLEKPKPRAKEKEEIKKLSVSLLISADQFLQALSVCRSVLSCLVALWRETEKRVEVGYWEK